MDPRTARACPSRSGCDRGGRRSRVARSRRAHGLAHRASDGGRVRLANAEGTLWHGRGVVAAANAQDPDRVGHRVRAAAARRRCASACARTSAPSRRAARIAFRGERNRVARHRRHGSGRGHRGRARRRMAVDSVEGEVNAKHPRPRSHAGIEPRRSAPRLARRPCRGHWRVARLDLGEVRSTVIANGAAISGPVGNDGGESCASRRMDVSSEKRRSCARATACAATRRPDVELTRALVRDRHAPRATAGGSTGACRSDEPQAAATPARSRARKAAARRAGRAARPAAGTRSASTASTRCAAARCA